MQLNTPALCRLGAFALLIAGPTPALAYMGPGLGLGAIGSALGIVGAVLLAIVSVVWYPFKRMVRRMRGGAVAPANGQRSTPQS
ncbi:hypothetical protein [Acetobacter conturbans]|uniref:Uncharacterized protein n=1 Tax=Acetobacter conturbans TaxID=1737472 RepID=A0ABX0K6K3_9PROT|nr:hypothetical protein [Acetobacter conturbans]NHN89049.1 hypothetical protein [Acetobacter conturbans]